MLFVIISLGIGVLIGNTLRYTSPAQLIKTHSPDSRRLTPSNITTTDPSHELSQLTNPLPINFEYNSSQKNKSYAPKQPSNAQSPQSSSSLFDPLNMDWKLDEGILDGDSFGRRKGEKLFIRSCVTHYSVFFSMYFCCGQYDVRSTRFFEGPFVRVS